MRKIVFIILSLILILFLGVLVEIFLNKESDTLVTIESLIATIVTLFIVVAMIILKMLATNKYMNYFNEKISYVHIQLLICLSAGIFPLFIINIFGESLSRNSVIVIMVSSLLAIAASFISAFFYLKKEQENSNYRNEIILRDRLAETEKEYFDRTVEEYKKLRLFKHDISGHIHMVDSLLEQEQYTEAKEYVNQLKGRTHPNVLSQCSDVYIASTLNQFLNQLSENQIEFDLVYDLLKPLKMDRVDICSLFYNLMKNAIEASMKCESRKISLQIDRVGYHVHIHLENSVHSGFTMDELDVGTTTKDNKHNHGFGLENIHHIIEKHNGDIRYEYQSQKLETSIILLDAVLDM
ncbi:sensor histidine kinase [Amedibacillus sp. YH-ame6]